jgi:hypothetical protein
MRSALTVVAVLVVLTAALIIQALFESAAAAWFLLAMVMAYVGVRLYLRES